MGAYVLSETTGHKLLVEDGKVVGVRTGDKGRDKSGGEKGNFEPGSDVMAQATVLADGCWGHLTGAALKALDLAAKDPQVWALGVKEVWEIEQPFEKIVHTLGWPLRWGGKWKEFGGSWIYGMNREGETPKVSIGFVTGLDWADSRFSVHDVLQEFKLHPLVRRSSKTASASPGARRRSPRAATGRCPSCTRPAWSSAGDAGGMVNVPKLKGIHYAIESGRLAAETIYQQLKAGSNDFSAYEKQIYDSDDGQGALRVAQHEAAVRQGPDPGRRDHQRDGRDQGPLPGRPLGHAPRRRGPAAEVRPLQALSQAGRQVHVRQAQRRLPHRQRHPRRRAVAHPDRAARPARGRRRAGPTCARPASTRSPTTRPRRA